MKKNQAGFVDMMLVIIIAVLLLGMCYLFYKHRHVTKVAPTTAKSQSIPPAIGSTAAIDNLTSQEVNNETAVDQKHSGESATAQSANSAAANIGSAYNESSL